MLEVTELVLWSGFAAVLLVFVIIVKGQGRRS
jgi:hypothetical protein